MIDFEKYVAVIIIVHIEQLSERDMMMKLLFVQSDGLVIRHVESLPVEVLYPVHKKYEIYTAIYIKKSRRNTPGFIV